MAYAYSVNALPSTGPLAMYQLIALLISQGWSNKSDSDGTTYSATGGQVTGGGTGAHGLGNNDAWVRLQCPTTNGNKRELCIQRGTGNTAWRITYSAAAGFTGGSPGATQVPTATDEVVIAGGGTDGSPSFATLLPTDNTYRCHAVAGASTEGYSFWFAATTTGAFFASGSTLWTFDTLATFDASDVDPTWQSLDVPASGIAPGGLAWADGALVSSGSAGTGAWMGATSSASNFVFVDACHDQKSGFPATGSGSSQYGQNPFSSNDVAIPIFVARRSDNTAPTGGKGWLSMGKWATTFRSSGDTLSVSSPGAKDNIYVNGSVLPWSGATPLD